MTIKQALYGRQPIFMFTLLCFVGFLLIVFRKMQGECSEGPISPSSALMGFKYGFYMLYQGSTSSFCLISFLFCYLHWCETVWILSILKCGEGNVGIKVEMSIACSVLWWSYSSIILNCICPWVIWQFLYQFFSKILMEI